MSNYIKFWFAIGFSLLLSACGGGGGGSESSGSTDSPPPNTVNAGSDLFGATLSDLKGRVAIDATETPLSLDSAPALLSALYEFYYFAQQSFDQYQDPALWGGDALQDESDEQACAGGGSVKVESSAENAVLAFRFSNCVDGGVTLDGAQRVTWQEMPGNTVRILVAYNEYSVIGGAESLQVDGSVDMTVSRDLGYPLSLTLDLMMEDQNRGVIRANSVEFQVDSQDTAAGNDFYASLTHVSGLVEYEGWGVSRVGLVDAGSGLRLSGSTPAWAQLSIEPDGLVFAFDDDGDLAFDNRLFVAVPDEYAQTPLHQLVSSVPEVRSKIFIYEDAEPISDGVTLFDTVSFFRDPGGNLLQFEADLKKVELVPDSSLDSERIDLTGHADVSYSLSQLHAGYFSLESATPGEIVKYTFEIRAKNAFGVDLSEPLLVEIPVYSDLDGDGEFDYRDSDDDGDGVDDGADAFPRDKSESVDTDGDGVGNNQDVDDDGDGVADVEDAQPLDWVCSAIDDMTGDVCSFRTLNKTSVFVDKNGVVYFWSPFEDPVYRWDSVDQSFLPAVSFNPVGYDFPSREQISGNLHYSTSDHAVYVFRQYSYVSRVDLSAGFDEKLFFDGDDYDISAYWISGMQLKDESPQGPVFAVNRMGGIDQKFFSLAADGSLMDEYAEPVQYADDPSNFRPHDVAPFCDSGFYVDSDGVFVDIGVGGPASDPCVSGEPLPVVSGDGQLALTRYGVMDQARNIVAVPDLAFNAGSAQWANGELYFLDREQGTVSRYSSTGEKLDSMTLRTADQGEQYAYRIFTTGSQIIIVTRSGDVDGFVYPQVYAADVSG
ncbi:hypothetical protein [Microbulbifer sp. SAOS-129_SWC]|uniref:hypothetical protein n=1 Tax=Microbulbifer sp. SAOS-129_SWC TaxID=3145235 RepID=UPI003216E005